MASPGDLEPPTEQQPDGARSISLAARAGQRWRDKLKDKASRFTAKAPERGATSADDVGAFLRPESAQSATSPPPPPPHKSPLASRRTSPAPPDEARAPPPPPNRPPWKFKRKLPRGTHVGFTDHEPDIIGEGGDEAELPSKDVRGSWAGPGTLAPGAAKPKPPPPSALMAGGGHEGPPAKREEPDLDERDFSNRLSLARAPTRKPVGGWHHKRRSMNMEEGLVQAQVAGERASNGSTSILGEDFLKSPVSSLSSGLGYAPFEPQQANLQSPQEEERPSSSRSEGGSSILSSFKAYDPTSAPTAAPTTAPATYSSARIQEDELSPIMSQPSLTLNDPRLTSPRKSFEDTTREDPRRDPRRDDLRITPPRKSFEETLQEDSRRETRRDDPRREDPRREDLRREDPRREALRREDPRKEDPVREEPRREEIRRKQAPVLPLPTNTAPSTYPPPQLSPDFDVPEGQDESEDFYSRVQHLRGVFRLASEKSSDIESKALEHWLRAAAWWFLRGKSMLESNIRMATMASKSNKMPPSNLQSYVNLAKAWWICEDVLPDMLDPTSPAVRRNAHDRIDGLDFGQLFDAHQAMLATMRNYAIFLSRKDILPPAALLVQGADPSIWIEAPPLGPGMLALAARLDPRTLAPTTKNPFFPIPLADSRRHFSYGRVFGEAEIAGPPSDQTAPAVLPCLISIIRDRNSAQAELTLTSQDGQLNTHVQADPRAGPTWRDVEWKVKERRMRVRLAADFRVTVRMWEADFKTLWGIHDYIQRVAAERGPRSGEALVFEHVLSTFHYVPPPGATGATTFPTAPVKACLVRLFVRAGTASSGGGPGAGFRMTIVTPPALKTLSSLTRVYGRGAPVLYSNLRGDDNAPALLLATREEAAAGPPKRSSVVLTFQDIAARVELLGLLSGLAVAGDEMASGDVPVKQVSVALTPTGGPAEHGSRELVVAGKAQWQSLRVIGPAPEVSSPGGAKAQLERSRICVTCSYGTVTDVVSLRPGELRISLDIVNTTMIKLHRPAQSNLAIAFADNLVPKDEVELLHQVLKAVAAGPTARIYKFPTLPGLFLLCEAGKNAVANER